MPVMLATPMISMIPMRPTSAVPALYSPSVADHDFAGADLWVGCEQRMPPPAANDPRESDTREDPELVAAAARGDGSALGALYDRHAALLLALGRRILGSESEAEDLVHDVLLEAWRRADSYQASRGTVRAWLVVRTRSRALDRLKAAPRTRSVNVGGDEFERMPSLDDPSATADRLTVRGAVTELPPQQLEVLLLGYYEGLSSREIAERLELPIGTVKSRVAAGLSKLRQDLQDRRTA
jgi:RNA polymerase sigma-70 factor, ECF subfamily